MSVEENKGSTAIGSAAPERDAFGARQSTARERALATVAGFLRRLFPELTRTRAGVNQLLRRLRRHLVPPGRPGRPPRPEVTRALELKEAGLPWPKIYERCIEHYRALPELERRYKAELLRQAVRARRRARKQHGKSRREKAPG